MKKEQFDWQDKLELTKERLDEISPTFCAAKWLQVTLHLQNGLNHSCHHPPPHKIPLSELEKDPAALHNTSFKREQREKMLLGERPKECDFCWRVEDATNEGWSDRFIKSSDSWAPRSYRRLALNKTPDPTYLEVSFGNTCNLKCMYCTPEVSSAIWGELEKFGPYPVPESNSVEWYEKYDRRPYKIDQDNPYLNAFREWFPKIFDGLYVLRITGGEPLLSPETFRTLDFLSKQSNPKLEFCLNSNLMLPEAILSRTAKQLQELALSKKVKNVRIYTSVDAHGEQANWIRNGLDYDQLLLNCQSLLTTASEVGLTFIATHNFFSHTTFKKLLIDILKIKQQFISKIEPIPRVMIDVSYVRHPYYLSSLLASSEIISKSREALDFMKQNLESESVPWGFNDYEVNKLSRLCDVFEKPVSEKDLVKNQNSRKDLKKFVLEFDRRKRTDFKKVFPEYVQLMDSIKIDE